MRVAAYILSGNRLAQSVVPLLAAGAALSEQVVTYTDRDYTPEHLAKYDAAIFWGYVETCQAIMSGYREAGKAAVYLDLAYWARDSHYKVSINSRHPTAYFQKHKHDDSRRKRFVASILPYRAGGSILLAGMGAKAAWAEKLEPVNSWETKAVAEIKKHTDRPIIFRPKTTAAPPISGSTYEPNVPLVEAFAKSNVIVTHHSNVAVDGLINGVPVFCFDGVASVMGLQDLKRIEDPSYPEGREQWVNDIAYCQWSVGELKNGACWRHLKDEGLVK